MNTLAHPTDSREPDYRTGPSSLNRHVQSHGATGAVVQSNDAAAGLSFQSLHWLAKDDNGSHLVNFPFAFAVSMILTTGLTVAGSGIIVTNAWLTMVGIFVTLIGCVLYGKSLYDE